MRVREIRAGNGSFFVDHPVSICACCGSINTQDIETFNSFNSGYTIFAGATQDDINKIIPSDEHEIYTVPLEDGSFLLIKCNTNDNVPEEDEDD